MSVLERSKIIEPNDKEYIDFLINLYNIGKTKEKVNLTISQTKFQVNKENQPV
jgi:hypothetical protein